MLRTHNYQKKEEDRDHCFHNVIDQTSPRCYPLWIYPGYPGYKRFFLACGGNLWWIFGNLRCRRKAALSSAVDRSHEHDKVRKPRRKNLWHRGYIQGCGLTKICTEECKLFLFWHRPNRVIEYACRLIQTQKSTNPERKTRTCKSQCFIGVCYTNTNKKVRTYFN